MKKISFLAIFLMVMGLMASDMDRDVVMFGSIFSTALNASGKTLFKVSPFVVKDYGVFYFIQSPMRRAMREKMSRKWRNLPQQKKEEVIKKIQERKGQIMARIREGVKRGIAAAAQYGDVLKSVPDNYWLVFVFQSPRSIGPVSYPCMVVRVRMRDVREFSRGKISQEEFAKRIILPPLEIQNTPPTQ